MADSKPTRNPAFRMMGLPNFRFKRPSRNWLIFWTITGSFTSTLLYDRYYKKRAQRKWCTLVSHLADEPLPTTTLPRRITIFLAAPPGDSLRAAREHFHEYIKPVLVAGALDWEVIEGRREGEVRAGLAEKIRKLRKRKGERPPQEDDGGSSEDDSQEQLMYELRQRTGIKDFDGVQGDLILGRHTWKEYIRGLHEGWLGPLTQREPPDQPSEPSPTDSPNEGLPSDEPPSTEAPTTEFPPAKKSKPTPTPPYIRPADYSSCSISPFLDSNINPSLPLPLPHLLGFLNTPVRVYRFLTRRHLADSTGRSVAALVLATQTRPYNQSADYAPANDPDENSPSMATSADDNAVVLAKEVSEQEVILKHEEKEWHKSAWKANDEGDDKERVWQEPVVVDSRIGRQMSEFELPRDEEERAVRLDAKRREEAEGMLQRARRWIGWTEKERKGWEMGLEGDESE